jgi:hypothetical protein
MQALNKYDFHLENFCPRPPNLQMDRPKPKKKAVPPVQDPDMPDSLVSALANELLARENLNLIWPVALFTVQH